jgi:hypothetical protein
MTQCTSLRSNSPLYWSVTVETHTDWSVLTSTKLRKMSQTKPELIWFNSHEPNCSIWSPIKHVIKNLSSVVNMEKLQLHMCTALASRANISQYTLIIFTYGYKKRERLVTHITLNSPALSTSRQSLFCCLQPTPVWPPRTSSAAVNRPVFLQLKLVAPSPATDLFSFSLQV